MTQPSNTKLNIVTRHAKSCIITPTAPICEWLRDQFKQGRYRFLLAHSSEGVIWGRADEEGLLITLTCADVAQLDNVTLQQARCFNDEGELFLWRDGDGNWHARIITDCNANDNPIWTLAMDEAHMLWGDRSNKQVNGFTQLTDGSQGLVHWVPLNVTFAPEKKDKQENLSKRPLRLMLRHYIGEDVTGFRRVVARDRKSVV